jgi:hypothetical protein
VVALIEQPASCQGCLLCAPSNCAGARIANLCCSFLGTFCRNPGDLHDPCHALPAVFAILVSGRSLRTAGKLSSAIAGILGPGGMGPDEKQWQLRKEDLVFGGGRDPSLCLSDRLLQLEPMSIARTGQMQPGKLGQGGCESQFCLTQDVRPVDPPLGVVTNRPPLVQNRRHALL